MAAFEFDDVHCCHRQTGTVHHTADVAFQRNIVQVEFGCFQLAFVFLGFVAQFGDFRQAVKGVAVDTDFAVHAGQRAVFADCQRVHFKQGEVVFDKRFVRAGHQFNKLVDLFVFQAQLERNFTRLARLQADQRVNGYFENFFRGFGGDFFDFHTAFGRSHECDATGRTVDHRAQIQLGLHRIHVFANQNAVDRLTVGIGLISNQIGANQAFCHFFGFFTAFDDFYAARFTASACVDLGFDDGKFAAQFVVSGCGFFAVVRQNTALHGQAVACQQFFSLILV